MFETLIQAQELIPEVSSGRNPYDLRKVRLRVWVCWTSRHAWKFGLQDLAGLVFCQVCTESSAINCYDFTLEKEYLNDVEVPGF